MLGGPAGAGAPAGGGKINRVVGSILSLALDNNANGLFAQPQGIFDFGEGKYGCFFFGFAVSPEAEEARKKERLKKTLGTRRDAFFSSSSHFSLTQKSQCLR